MPHLPVHCWGDDTLKDICNKLRKYIDKEKPKQGIFQCARLYVEVDLQKGLPEAIHLLLDNWSHYQQLDYEQIPFKCKSCILMVILQKIARKLGLQLISLKVEKKNRN